MLDALATVPWQQWLALAAAGWIFALVCFVGFSTPRRRREEQPEPSMPVPRPDVVVLLRDYERTYRRRRAA